MSSFFLQSFFTHAGITSARLVEWNPVNVVTAWFINYTASNPLNELQLYHTTGLCPVPSDINSSYNKKASHGNKNDSFIVICLPVVYVVNIKSIPQNAKTAD